MVDNLLIVGLKATVNIFDYICAVILKFTFRKPRENQYIKRLVQDLIILELDFAMKEKKGFRKTLFIRSFILAMSITPLHLRDKCLAMKHPSLRRLAHS